MPVDSFVQLGRILAWWTGGKDDGDGDHARARDIVQRILDFGTRALGPDHHKVLSARIVLAHQLGKLGDTAQALAISREVAGTAARVYGPTHDVTLSAIEECKRWGSPA